MTATPLLKKEAAEVLGLDPAQITRMVKDGRLKPDESGRIPIPEIERYLDWSLIGVAGYNAQVRERLAAAQPKGERNRLQKVKNNA